MSQNLFRRIWIKIRLFFNPENVIIKGACKQCGSCCRELILVDERKTIRSAEAFNVLKEKYPQYQIFKINRVNKDGDMIFECTRINADNTCSVYEDRPAICRQYPSKKMFLQNGKLFAGCGYYTESVVPFEDILAVKTKM